MRVYARREIVRLIWENEGEGGDENARVMRVWNMVSLSASGISSAECCWILKSVAFIFVCKVRGILVSRDFYGKTQIFSCIIPGKKINHIL